MEKKNKSEPIPRHYYVSVSDRVFDPNTVFYPETPDSGCEIDQSYKDAGTVYIGELTKKQSVLFWKEFRKLYKGPYVIGFYYDESYPPEEPAAKVSLNNDEFLIDDQKRALDIAVPLANSVRDAYGCGSKNIALRNKPVRKPTNKPRQPKNSPQTRKRTSKYENAVENYLLHLVDAVNKGDISPKSIENLTSGKVAEILHKNNEFITYKKKGTENKASIGSIHQGVRRSKAWRSRNNMLKQADGSRPPGLKEAYGDWKDTDTELPNGVSKVDCGREVYEEPVEEFLQILRNKFLIGKISSEEYGSTVAKLTLKAVAMWIKDNIPTFKDKGVETIEKGVKYCKAWINRGEILNVET